MLGSGDSRRNREGRNEVVTTTAGLRALHEEMGRRGIRMAQAARELLVSKPTIAGWLNGARPGDEHKIRLQAWSHGRIRAAAWLEEVSDG
jgi:hypothetical protein